MVAGLRHGLLWPIGALAEARGILFPWVPVCMGLGIGGWFSLANEPGATVYLAAAAVLLCAALLWWLGPEVAHPLWVATGCVALGLLLAGARGHSVAAPVLSFRYYGPVQGRVIDIDRSQSDALRLTLDQVVLEAVPPDRTPQKVRVALHAPQPHLRPEPGQVVQLTGHLAAPEGPPEPGGLDFQRMAWFQRLGAVGYSRTPVLLLDEPLPNAQRVNRLRARLSAGVQAAIPGDAGAFASGVMTGDRSGLSLQAVQDLRASSLAHLLAISGMNMAFLVGFVFALCRTGLALVPPLALRVNAKKIAAVISFGVAWFYLLLSGANVATERAFIMVAVMLGAVLLDRRALSLRSVAISAVILLALRPESLLDPGFQMSFAATTALIAGFGALEGGVMRGRVPRWALPVFTLILSSALAGVATAPYGAAHFNRIADFGFVANLLTVPVMGAVVMPAGALAALLAPFGLAALPLWLMGLGCDWILFVAHVVAGWEGAVTAVPIPGSWVLPLVTLGGIWLAVWRGYGRLVGVAPILIALGLWTQATRPDLLVAPDAALIGLATEAGRVLSAPKGAGFAAQSWLENDGDLADQPTAAARSGMAGTVGNQTFRIGAWQVVYLKGKAATERLPAACANADLVIIAADGEAAPKGCQVIDPAFLKQTGGLALWQIKDSTALRLDPVRQGHRLWQGRARPILQSVHLDKTPRVLAAAQ